MPRRTCPAARRIPPPSLSGACVRDCTCELRPKQLGVKTKLRRLQGKKTYNQIYATSHSYLSFTSKKGRLGRRALKSIAPIIHKRQTQSPEPLPPIDVHRVWRCRASERGRNRRKQRSLPLASQRVPRRQGAYRRSQPIRPTTQEEKRGGPHASGD
jgi:hypothetical protein